MRNIKKKIHQRIKRQFKLIENNLYGTYISLSAGYKKINQPLLNNDFIENLFSDKSAFVKLLNKNLNAKKDSEKILDNKFEIFKNEINYKKGSDFWYVDYFSGYTYPLVPYTKLKFIYNRGYDPIVPWEISRMQFIPTLIKAHKETGDKKIFHHFITIVDDWINKNPYLIGINWISSMDVGVRSINLGLGLFYFWNLIPEIKKEYYLKVLWGHAVFILNKESYLTKNSVQRGNHYMVSTVSLLFLSLCFSGEKSLSYLNNTFKELIIEIIGQFREDGVIFESANHYHQFSLEAVLLAEVFLSCFSKPLSLLKDKKVKEKLESALKFVSDYMTTNTRSPQFGDSSDARVIIFKDYFDWDPVDHDFLFDISEQLSLYKKTDRNITSLYSSSGYAFSKNKKYGLSINCSKIWGNESPESGHNHLDKLSFLLQVNGSPLFIDPGTYCYTSSLNRRNEYRETRAHNTIIIDGKEQINFSKRAAFTPLNKANIDLKISEDKSNCFFLMHDGYKYINSSIVVKREIKCLDRKIVMEDFIEGSGDHIVEIIYNLHPEIKFKTKGKEIIFLKDQKEICRLHPDAGLDVLVEDSFYSPSYRKEIKNKRIILKSVITLPIHFTNTLIIAE